MKNIMKLGNLNQLITEMLHDIDENFEIWLSCDEEGNEYLPMPENKELSIGIDKSRKMIVFFPSHR